MIQRFRKVSSKLYRGSAPTTDDVIWLNKYFKITRIISLDDMSGQKINLACQLLKINHIDLSIDMSKSSMIRFLSNIGKLFESNEKTFLHCKWGKDRSGLACAIYRCQKQGWLADDAIKEAKSLDFGKGLSPDVAELYISIIKNIEKDKDENFAADIVGNARGETYDDYVDGSPSSNLSWSPYADHNVKEFPQTTMHLNDQERNPLGGFGPSIVGDGTTI